VTLLGIEAVPPDKIEPSETAKPPLGAADVNETVHNDDVARLIVVGLQLIAERATGRSTVTVAGEPAVAMDEPVALTADTFKSWIAVVVADVFAAKVTLAVASVPAPMVAAFMPTAIQVYRPALVMLHVRVLPAPVAAEPAVTDTAVISAVAYPKVHMTPVAAALLPA
jgi:hypothetical protein